MKITKHLDIKISAIFWVLFFLLYTLLNYIYNEIIHFCFSDVFERLYTSIPQKYNGLNMHRLRVVHLLAIVKTPFLLIILGLICVYIKWRGKKYFNESIAAFLTFIVAVYLLKHILLTIMR